MKRPISLVLAVTLGALVLCGCRSMYYSTMEAFGKHKRDLLKSNVKAASEEQKEASEEFKDALTRLKEMYGFKGGELERVYNALKSDYDRCSAAANEVKERVGKVETIAADLFKEWESELKTIQNETLRADSRRKLDATRKRFDTLHASMKKAEESMDPVLVQFRDQVTYLKHNLNAAAIGSLQGEATSIEQDISKLIADMNASIKQADEFIKTME